MYGAQARYNGSYDQQSFAGPTKVTVKCMGHKPGITIVNDQQFFAGPTKVTVKCMGHKPGITIFPVNNIILLLPLHIVN